MSGVKVKIWQRLMQWPWHLRWLSQAPVPVQQADEAMRRTFFSWNLPVGVLLILVFEFGRWLGAYPQALWGQWILVLAVLVFAWPASILRLGLVAGRSLPDAEGGMRRRLKALYWSSVLLAGLAFVALATLIVGMVWWTASSL